MSKKKTHREFIKELYNKNKHFREGKFDVVGHYESLHKHILLKTKYGQLISKPSNLLSGKCPTIQSAVDKTKYSLCVFREVHGDTYDYSEFEYIKAKSNSIIICKEHGRFSQSYDTHRKGVGCWDCARSVGTYEFEHWSSLGNNDNACIYLLRLYDENEEFLKVGITNSNVKTRYSCKKDIPYNYEILKEVEIPDKKFVWDLEQYIKVDLSNQRYKCLKSFPGSKTEVFGIEHKDYIESEILDLERNILNYYYEN